MARYIHVTLTLPALVRRSRSYNSSALIKQTSFFKSFKPTRKVNGCVRKEIRLSRKDSLICNIRIRLPRSLSFFTLRRRYVWFFFAYYFFYFSIAAYMIFFLVLRFFIIDLSPNLHSETPFAKFSTLKNIEILAFVKKNFNF